MEDYTRPTYQADVPMTQRPSAPIIPHGQQMQQQRAMPPSLYTYRNPTMAQSQTQMQTQMTPQLPPQVIPAPIAANPTDIMVLNALTQPMPVTMQSLQYINAFLRTQIGKKVTVDFLLGTDSLQDRTGTLLGVGTNYILLNEVETDDLLVCDFYTIKFVKVYY